MTHILDVAVEYYKAMGNKDINEMGKYLHQNLEFLGPVGIMKGKKEISDAAQKFFSFYKDLKIRSKFASSDQVMIVYDLGLHGPVPQIRVAALLDFKDDLISKIELFYDARMLESMKGSFFPNLGKV